MTDEEAIKQLTYMENMIDTLFAYGVYTSAEWKKNCKNAIGVAVHALTHKIWEDTLWHDAKTDPPKSPGLYYGKQDDTNSMYAVNYRDGVWTLDCYPGQNMNILQWAEYAAFWRREDDG